MKLSSLFMIALLAGTLGVFGCSDDPPATGNGGSGGEGTAGTGGDGTAGTGGGTAGTGGGNASCGTEPAQELCCFGLCLGDDAASQLRFDECVDAVNLCLNGGGTTAECQVVADQKCVGG
jgi:hypothetical protein